MSECIFCEEDAGEGYDVCISCRNKKNEVTLGNKPIGVYLKKILELGMEHNQIRIKTLYIHADKYNYCIKPLMEYWGLEETGKRKWVNEIGIDGKELKVLHILMEMIPSLRGIKTDKRR